MWKSSLSAMPLVVLLLGSCSNLGVSDVAILPTMSPAAGTFSIPTEVTIQSRGGYTIYYTTDGTDPKTGSTVASKASPVTITVSQTTTINARAGLSSSDLSDLVTATYTITPALSTAPDISSGVAQAGSIASKGTELAWKFSAVAGQVVSVNLSMPANSVDPHVKLAPESGVTAWEASDTDGSDAASILVSPNLLVTSTGLWSIKVYDEGSDDVSGTSFSVTVTVSANPDANEPANETRANAILLTAGLPKQAYIATKADVDWYKFQATAGQTMTFTGTMAACLIDLQLQAYTEYGTDASWQQVDGNGSDGPTSLANPQVVIPADGLYYLRVSDQSDDESDLSVPYSIQVNLSSNPDANEPANDTRANALLLAAGTAKQGYIATKGDVDWYKFEATAGQMFTFTGKMAASTVDLFMRVYTQYGQDASWEQADSNGEDGPTSLANPQVVITTAGTYYLRVFDWSDDDWDSANPYTIQVNLATNPDLNEPANDTRANALELFPGVLKQAYIATKGDVDWYRFHATAGQMLTFTGNMTVSNVDLYMQLYADYEQNPSWVQYDGDGSDRPTALAYAQVVIPTTGDYWLRVFDWYDDEWDSTSPYTIQVNVAANKDANEPANDTRANAYLLTSGLAKTGYIATKGDVDWYKFYATAGQMLTFTGNLTVSDVDLYMQIYADYEQNPSWIQYDNDGSDRPTALTYAQVAIPTDGYYWLRVFDWYDDEWDSTSPYTIQVNVAANKDASEPSNDLRANAVAITSGVAKTGYIATKGDVDWYKFVANAGQKLTFTGSLDVSSVDLYIQVFSTYDQNPSWYQYDGDGSDQPTSLSNAQVDIPMTGTYYLRVFDWYDDEWDSTSPYTIQVNVTN